MEPYQSPQHVTDLQIAEQETQILWESEAENVAFAEASAEEATCTCAQKEKGEMSKATVEKGGDCEFGGLSSVLLSQESSALGDAMESVPHHLFSAGEESQLAKRVHHQAEKICPTLQQSKTFPIHSQTHGVLIKGEEEVSLRRHNFPTKVVSGFSSNGLCGELFPLPDLSLKVPHSLGGGKGFYSSSDDKMSSENSKPRSLLEPVIPQELSTIVPSPRSPTLSPGFLEHRKLNDGIWRKNSLKFGLHSSQEGGGIRKHSDGLGNYVHREGENYSAKKRCRYALKKSSEFLSLALQQRTCTTNILYEDPQIPSQEQGESVSLQVTAPSVSLLNSSEYNSSGAEINATGTTSNEFSLRNSHKSQELDAMSELEKCKEKEHISMLGFDTDQGTTELKSEGCGSLHLLLNAIQMASGGIFGGEDHEGPEPSDMIIDRVIEADLNFGSEKLYLVHGRSAIVKKKVLRRARSAFKKQSGGDSLQNVVKFEIPGILLGVPFCRRKRKGPPDENHEPLQEEDVSKEVKYGCSVVPFCRRKRKGHLDENHEPPKEENVSELHVSEVKYGCSVVPFCRRKRKGHPDENHEPPKEENVSKLHVSEVKYGCSVVQSRRGRSQVLPTKFSDSILQPWKRKSRRKHR